MKGYADSEGAREGSGGFELVSEGWHVVELTEVSDKVSKNGDPMFGVKYEITQGQFKGQWLFDNIIIPQKGSPAFKIMGRTMHFLHVIGQPYEGKFDYDTEKWIWSKLKVNVKHEIQKEGKNAGKPVAKVKGHDFLTGKPDEKDDEIPF